jgi:hypothetical protein
MEELAKDARLRLLVSHTLAPGTVVGILMMLGEAFKCRHPAGALGNWHCQWYVRWGCGERGETHSAAGALVWCRVLGLVGVVHCG